MGFSVDLWLPRKSPYVQPVIMDAYQWHQEVLEQLHFNRKNGHLRGAGSKRSHIMLVCVCMITTKGNKKREYEESILQVVRSL